MQQAGILSPDLATARFGGNGRESGGVRWLGLRAVRRGLLLADSFYRGKGRVNPRR